MSCAKDSLYKFKTLLCHFIYAVNRKRKSRTEADGREQNFLHAEFIESCCVGVGHGRTVRQKIKDAKWQISKIHQIVLYQG